MVQIIYQGTKDYYPEFKAHTGNQETESATLTMTITNLVPGTEYTFVVIAKTPCGYGGNSSVVQESTKVDGKLFTVCLCSILICSKMVYRGGYRSFLRRVPH